MVNAEGVVPQSIESISESRAPEVSIARSQYAVALTVQIAASIVFTGEATVLVVRAQDMVCQFMEHGGHHARRRRDTIGPVGVAMPVDVDPDGDHGLRGRIQYEFGRRMGRV